MRLAKIATISLLVIALISTVACSSSTKQEPIPTLTITTAPTPVSVYETYTNNNKGFSISIPESWNVSDYSNIIRFFPTTETWMTTFDLIWPNMVYTSAQDMYDDFADNSDPTFEIISYEAITLAGIPAIKAKYRASFKIYSYSLNTTPMIGIRVFFINQNTAWELSGIWDPECLIDYESTYNTMISSFRFLD
jgi:hypothetical protein